VTNATARTRRGSPRTPIVVLVTALVAGCVVTVAIVTALNEFAPTSPYGSSHDGLRSLARGVAFMLGILGIVIGAKIALGGWPLGTSGIRPEEWWIQAGRRVSRFVVGLAIVVFFVPILSTALLL
jgi:hypothetical protein